MVRCMVIDDEPLAIQVLEKYISETAGLSLLHKCRNAIEGFQLLKPGNIDLLFLDIEMPLVNGIDLLKTIKNPPKTIFTTAYKEYAFESYELNVVDYLLKPISFERFSLALAKFNEYYSANEPVEDKYLVVKDRQGLMKVAHSAILYIEGCKDYVKVLTAAQSFLVLKTMKEMLEELGPAFIRVHRSFIVPVNRIKVMRSDSVLTDKDESIPIGSFYKNGVMEAFGSRGKTFPPDF